MKGGTDPVFFQDLNDPFILLQTIVKTPGKIFVGHMPLRRRNDCNMVMSLCPFEMYPL